MAPAAFVSNVAPSAVTGPAPRKPLVQLRKPQSLIDGAQLAKKESFDPKKHMNYQALSKIHTMAEISLKGHGIPAMLFVSHSPFSIRRLSNR